VAISCGTLDCGRGLPGVGCLRKAMPSSAIRPRASSAIEKAVNVLVERVSFICERSKVAIIGTVMWRM
jgi:hypothetical protein